IALVTTLCWFLLCSPTTSAQTPQKPQDQSDVVRVYTELVQTDVMVFDKQGQFVDGLRREDFELRIDGKPRPIDFFERVTAGSVSEESQLAAARGSGMPAKAGANATLPLDRGRTIFFYIDDMHLDLSSTALTRKLVLQFIDKEMGQNDEAAITSASGKIGFLQQLTDNRTVLRLALERLKPGNYSVTDNQRPPMTEYQALLIDRYDRDTTDFFVEALLKEIPLLTRDSAESMVRSRAHGILAQAANVTRATLAGLESLVRSSSSLPGRKIVFFISNGFFLDNRNSDSVERLQRLTSAAARSGVVIYSMDARGLVASLTDASSDVAFDPSGRLERASAGELVASQDALNALARDTGGRPVFNTNNLQPGLKKALNESSTYYLLAWKPDPGTQATSKFRKIEVRLVNKSDLSVRVRRGFYDIEPPTVATKNQKPAKPEKTLESKLGEAITTPYPQRGIPIALSLSYVNTPNKGDMLSTSMQIPGEFLSFVTEGDKSKAVVELAGFVYDERGRVGAKFDDRLTVTTDVPVSASVGNGPNRAQDIVYNFPVYLSPGIYQVRVGARDAGNGKVGSAHGWIEIPNLSLGQLAMSSLLVGERERNSVASAAAANTAKASTGSDPTDQVNLSVDRRLRRDSYLRFLVFVYNATRAATDSRPDAAVQVQLIRDDQPVVTTVLRKIEAEGVQDLARLPYAADVPLSTLSSGRYVLHVTVVDRLSKRSASQQTRFEVY
ncbi:MAG: VWA domain-containing protein, partial [Pyrinomonadaceae bacterium]